MGVRDDRPVDNETAGVREREYVSRRPLEIDVGRRLPSWVRPGAMGQRPSLEGLRLAHRSGPAAHPAGQRPTAPAFAVPGSELGPDRVAIIAIARQTRDCRSCVSLNRDRIRSELSLWLWLWLCPAAQPKGPALWATAPGQRPTLGGCALGHRSGPAAHPAGQRPTAPVFALPGSELGPDRVAIIAIAQTELARARAECGPQLLFSRSARAARYRLRRFTCSCASDRASDALTVATSSSEIFSRSRAAARSRAS